VGFGRLRYPGVNRWVEAISGWVGLGGLWDVGARWVVRFDGSLEAV